jgi:hypothetical protein
MDTDLCQKKHSMSEADKIGIGAHNMVTKYPQTFLMCMKREMINFLVAMSNIFSSIIH